LKRNPNRGHIFQLLMIPPDKRRPVVANIEAVQGDDHEWIDLREDGTVYILAEGRMKGKYFYPISAYFGKDSRTDSAVLWCWDSQLGAAQWAVVMKQKTGDHYQAVPVSLRIAQTLARSQLVPLVLECNGGLVMMVRNERGIDLQA
jgi:hypothetical protein